MQAPLIVALVLRYPRFATSISGLDFNRCSQCSDFGWVSNLETGHLCASNCQLNMISEK